MDETKEAPDEELREPFEDVQEDEFRDIEEELSVNTPTFSQGSKIQESSGSLYIPSQESVGSCTSNILSPDESDPDDSINEINGPQINENLLIVPWTSLLVLLSKCQAHGCGEQVLPSNMKISTKGRINNSQF